ncbi:hypothetical protein SAMN05444274_1142 [Mariniphaga anaerophila]|uniref:Uncharacterized protein n=1 Tax=Mariniphaga anaerophila TaxID=1484053 RepID=A0A1M5FNX1_9BACT|nr:hypothetical protein SAMN05444274_1142 [Mariniphaga anaerophila]
MNNVVINRLLIKKAASPELIIVHYSLLIKKLSFYYEPNMNFLHSELTNRSD